MTKISLKNNNIVKQENKKQQIINKKENQIINTTSTTTTNKVPVTDNIVTSFVRYFKNCFQTPSAVVIDYSSNCKRTATSILTPGKNSKKRPRTVNNTNKSSTTSTSQVKMMLNNTNTTSQNPYASGTRGSANNSVPSSVVRPSNIKNPRSNSKNKNPFAGLEHDRCESPRISNRKRFLPNIAECRQQQQRPQHTVCDYSLDKSLQNGYSGKVFKGHYHDPHQRNVHPVPVVVKCCKKFSSWNTETRALENLDHPNIIKLVGTPHSNVPATEYTSSIGSSSSSSSNNMENKQPRNRHLTPDSSPHSNLPLIHVLAQELASNGDLYELLQSHGSFNETIARTIIKPVVQGLLYAYETSGISHRDIKLENIFIHEDGTIKIGDWGLSGFDTKDRYCSSSCGTLGYMSPEMVCREKYDANKTDVWAIAVVLFSLCTGVRPYSEPKSRRKNPNDFSWRDEWLGAMMSGKWKLWWMSHARTTPLVKNMSNELCDLFEQMFHGDMDERASLHDVLNHRWMNGPLCPNDHLISLCGKSRRRHSK